MREQSIAWSRRARSSLALGTWARRKAVRVPGADASSLVLQYPVDESVKVCDGERLAQQCDGRPLAKTRVLRHLRAPTHEGESRQQARLLPFELVVETHALELRHLEVTQDEVV